VANHKHEYWTTAEEFEVAAAQTELSKRSIRAARLVLVDGLTYAAAARRVGMKSKQQVWGVTKRIMEEMT
jgi:hypothetical protein